MKKIIDFKKYSLKESKESEIHEDQVASIIEVMLEFIEEGHVINFKSATGEMNYRSYLDKNSAYQNFKPVVKAGNKIVSRFSMNIFLKNKAYEELVEFMENMKSAIGRLGEDGWVLSDLGLSSNYGNYGQKLRLGSIEYTFTKPDQELDEEFVPPSEDELREKIEQLGIHVQDIDFNKSEIVVYFGSYAYDGELNSEAFYDKKFLDIADIFGFGSYDLDYQKARVTFEF